MDGFFDMPAGYTDADMEMAALTEAGNRHARRVRKWGESNYTKLLAGETIAVDCRSRVTGHSYTALVKLTDDCPEYSIDGTTWHNSAREAREGGGA